MAWSLGLREAGEAVVPVASVTELLDGFALDDVPRDPWVFSTDH